MDSVVAEFRNNNLTIKVTGPFALPFFKSFYTAYKSLKAAPDTVTVDLARVESIDMIGMGMLLSMRNYFPSEIPISLINVCEEVRKSLAIGRLEKHFQISD